MIEVVSTHCMMGTAEGCVERRQESDRPAGVVGCMIVARRGTTRYLEAHPKPHLYARRCEKDEPRERPA